MRRRVLHDPSADHSACTRSKVASVSTISVDTRAGVSGSDAHAGLESAEGERVVA